MPYLNIKTVSDGDPFDDVIIEKASVHLTKLK